MTDYRGLREAVKGERELIEQMLKMDEKSLQQLMMASQSFAKARAEESKVRTEQEKTKQLELSANQQKLDREAATERHKLTMKAQEEQIKARHQEAKELQEKITQENKKRVDYAAKVQLDAVEETQRRKLKAKRELAELEEKMRQNREQEELSRLQREKEAAEEDLRRQERLIAHKLATKAKLDIEMMDFNLAKKKREHDLFYESSVKTQLALERERVQGEIEKEKQKWQAVQDFFTGEKGKERIKNIGLFSVGILVTYFGLKTAAPLIGQGLKNAFFKPKLVNKSMRYSPLRRLIETFNPPAKVILNPQIQERLVRVVEGTKNTAKRGGVFGHILMHGPPGTGKSMFAEELARNSRMDFAMMSGPSFDQFEPKDAIVEIKRLFAWANKSRHGLLLFVDECDSFLEDRSTLAPDRVRVLNEFINQTGTESRKFMLAFETNRPEVLDPAVQSRITQSVHFEPPGKAEMKLLLDQYVERYLHKEFAGLLRTPRHWLHRLLGRAQRIDTSIMTEEKKMEIVDQVAKHHFVGRDITNLVIALTQAAYSSKDMVITNEMVDCVVREQIEKKEKEQHFLEEREKRRERLRIARFS